MKHVLVVGPIGSRNAYTTFFRNKDNEICVKCGCFLGKIDKFLKKVSETHGDSQYAVVYRATVEVAKLQIDLNVQKPFDIGDKVRIITAEENTARNWNTAMEKYLGTVMTITRICSNGYHMEEDHGMWFWDNFRIAGKVENE